jgi:hypothetical protein
MMPALFSGVSGLRNHQFRMNVIGNNLANVNTVGFKYSRVSFSDLVYQTIRDASAPQSVGGSNPVQMGLGSIPSSGSYTAALCWDNSGASQVQDCVGSATADYAEIYPVSKDVEYGEIVTTSNDLVEVSFTETDEEGNPLGSEKKKVSRLVKSNKAYDGKIIGITSKNYGDFSSVGHNTVKKSDNPMSIALAGQW